MSVPVLPHRRDLRQGDLVFPEEILRIGHKMDFQFDCASGQIQREVFGPELDTNKIGDWLELYAAYDIALQDVVDLSIEKGFSRIPIYHEDIDNILGFIYVKDLLKYIGKDARDVRLTDLMRPATFVPETQKCADLFRQMTEQHRQIAVIVDEYGGTEGLITLEDLLEGIVGNIQDEYDHEEEEILPDGPNRWSVDGALFLDEVEDLTGFSLPEGDYDTLAGFLVSQLGRIPKPGEHPTVTCGPLTMTVLRVRERRIERIMVAKKAKAALPEAEDAPKGPSAKEKAKDKEKPKDKAKEKAEKAGA